MAKEQNDGALHKTNLAWFVWLEEKINELRMMSKSVIWIVTASFGAIAIIAFVTKTIGLYHPKFDAGFYVDFIIASVKMLVGSGDSDVYWKAWNEIKNEFLFLIFTHGIFGIAAGVFIFKYISGKTDEMGKSKRVDGTELIPEEKRLAQIKKLMKKGEFKFRFFIGRIPWPYIAEVTSLLIIATTGGGKGVLLSKIMKKLGSLSHAKGIVHDTKPEWIGVCYKKERGDLIFNPADKRSVRWSVFNDVRSIFDIKSLARWIVPINPDPKSAHFDDAARQIIESILTKLWEMNDTSNRAIQRAINMNAKELGDFISGYPGAKHLENKDVVSTLGNKTQWIDFLPDGNFSVRRWIDEAPRGLLFLSNGEETQALFSPVLNLFINAAGSHILTLPDDRNRRFFFILDEFATLGRIDRILDLLTKARSKGNSIIIALQDPSQGEKIYGAADWRTIIATCRSKAIGQIGDEESANKLAKQLGEQEFDGITGVTKSMGPEDNKDGLSHQNSRKKDLAVKGYQLLPHNLPTRTFFVAIDELPGVTRTTADIQDLPVIAENFVSLALTKEEQLAIIRGAAKVEAAKKEAEITEGLNAANETVELLDEEEGFTVSL